MSGGHFDYVQFHINEIADSIEETLNNQGKEIPKDELFANDDYYEKNPDEKLHTTYPKEIQDRFKKAIMSLRIASVYAQRVDWYLSGDDDEENFIKRLEEELKEIKPL